MPNSNWSRFRNIFSGSSREQERAEREARERAQQAEMDRQLEIARRRAEEQDRANAEAGLFSTTTVSVPDTAQINMAAIQQAGRTWTYQAPQDGYYRVTGYSTQESYSYQAVEQARREYERQRMEMEAARTREMWASQGYYSPTFEQMQLNMNQASQQAYERLMAIRLEEPAKPKVKKIVRNLPDWF